MNIIDWAIIIICLFGAWKGLRAGFIKTILSFVSFLISFLVAYNFYDILCRGLSTLFFYECDYIFHVISFILLFIITSILISIAANIIKAATTMLGMGLIDKTLGLFSGAALSFFFMCLIMFIVHKYSLMQNTFSNSFIFDLFVNKIVPYFPHISNKLMILIDDIGFMNYL